MKTYFQIVLCNQEGLFDFECEAIGITQAENIALRAYPDCDILDVWPLIKDFDKEEE